MASAGRLRQRARSWPLGWENLVDIPFKDSGDVVREGDAWQKAPFLGGVDALGRLTPTRAARSLPWSSRLGRQQREVAAGSNSDQRWSCCHCPSRLVSEASSESCLLLSLMGKKSSECFKEKCFIAARVFFSAGSAIFAAVLRQGSGMGLTGQPTMGSRSATYIKDAGNLPETSWA
jgi:hypothetical protein